MDMGLSCPFLLVLVSLRMVLILITKMATEDTITTKLYGY